MHRLGRIALVADRDRHHPVEGRIARAVLLGALAQPQAFHVAIGALHVRPHLLQEGVVAGIAPVLGDVEDQLAVAVVLRNRIAAARVHAAGHLAVLELVRGVPADILAHRVAAAHAQQALGNHRPVADPAARVGPRAGLDARPDARDQHVRQRSAQGVGQRLAGGGHLQGHLVQLGAPHRGHGLLGLGRVEVTGHRPGTGLRQHHGNLAALARLQRPAVQQRAGGQAGRVPHFGGGGQLAAGQVHDLQLAVESGGKGGIGRLRRVQARSAVDLDIGGVHRQVVDAAEATDGIEELRGRVDLPRAHGQGQGVLVGDLVRVAQGVAADQLGLVRAALDEAGHGQCGLVMAPVHAGDRQVVVLQRLGAGHVGPAQQLLAVHHDERLDAEAGLGHFQRAILADQCLLASAIQAQQGPVRLLATEPAWHRAARQVGADRADEIIGGSGKVQRFERNVTDAVAPARAALEVKAQIARLGIGQRQPVAVATASDHFAHFLPAASVLGGAHHVAGGLQAGQPLDHRTAELAHLVQVQADGLVGHATADPDRVRLAIGNAALQGGGGIGDHRRGQRRGIHRRQPLQGEAVETDRALATDLAVDRELHRRAAAERCFLARAPGLVDLAGAVLHRAPRLGEGVAGPVDPPHVVAAGIDQLELQVVGRRIAAQLQAELVIGRVLDAQLAADADIAGDVVEIVVQAQRAPTTTADHAAQRTADLVGDHQLPGRHVVEAVQHLRCRQRGRRGGRGRHRPQQPKTQTHRDDGMFHPLTLPSSRPWM
ncbi:hypothetical protein D3C71_1074590 [compost metagenome]